MKELMKSLIVEWNERNIPKAFPRELDIKSYLNLKIRKIIALNGFRRAGKTYAIFNLISKLLLNSTKKDIIYLNFEDERIPKTTEFLSSLIPSAIEINRTKPKILFLDEIQNMPEWSKWLRRIYDTEEISLCVTGSSSKMSSSGIPTELRGRFLEKSLYPLSFREFLLFKDYIFKMENIDYSEKEKALIINLLNEYLEYGGLPEIALSDEPIKVEIAKSYFQTIVKKDIVESHKIKNEEALKALLRLLLNSQKYTLNNTYNNLKSMQYIVGKGTLQSYLSHIEETYFMFSLPIFSYKIKEQSQYAKKCYFIDNIFISKLSGNMTKNKGRLYENSVAIELKRRYETFCYWENARNQEVDFVVIDKNKVSQIIQVCYDLSNFETKKREIRSALQASKELNCKDILIINESVEGEKKESWFGIKRNIKYMPLWKWLLSVKDEAKKR